MTPPPEHMFKTLDRYLLREITLTIAATAVVLLLVVVGGVFTDVLNKIARGKVPPVLLISQMGLRGLDALTLVMPLAAFLGVMLCMGRLYRDSEMAAIRGLGVAETQLLKPIALLAVPLAGVLAVLSLWWAPWAMATSDRMIREASRSLVVAGLEPGRFVELPGGEAVVYVAEMNDDARSFSRLFYRRESGGRVDLVTARRGTLDLEGDAGRFLVLEDGFRAEGVPGQADWRVMRFERNEVRLPDVEVEEERAGRLTASLPELFAMPGAEARAELHWRLAAPLSLLVLMALALPLSRQAPRQGRYGKLVLGVVLYLVYVNLLSLGRLWIGQERIPAQFGLWWIHLPMLWLVWWSLRPSRRRART